MGEIDDLPDKPGHLIRLAHQRSVAVFTAAARDYNITALQHILMVALNKYPNIDLSTLAGIVALDRSTTGTVAARLASRDIVEITPSADDRRAKMINLTPAGEKLLQDMVVAVQRSQRELLSPLSDAERAEFFKIIRRLVGRSSDHKQSATFCNQSARLNTKRSVVLDDPEGMLGGAIARRLSDTGAHVLGLDASEPADMVIFPRLWSADGLAIDNLGAELKRITEAALQIAERNRSCRLVLALVISEPGDPATPTASALRCAWLTAANDLASQLGASRCSAIVAAPPAGNRRRSTKSSPSEVLALVDDMAEMICSAHIPSGGGRAATVIDLTGFG